MVTDIDKEETKRRRKEHQLAVEQGKAQKVVKPLPPGYTCKACGAVEQHAIYNCPLKQTSKDKASVSRSPEDRRENTDDFGRGGDGEKELTEAKQVYISGLPYDMNVAKLLSLLKENGCEGVKQPFGVHLMTFADNPQKCKGVAFVTFVNAASAKSSIEKLSGLCLNESKPHLRLGCELNTRKQAQEWKPPSEARVSLNFSGNDHSGTGKKRKNLGKGNTKCCYRCGGLCQDPSKCTAERICYKCKGTGHLSSHCPLRKNPNLPSSTSSIISSENKKMKFDDDD
jgi:RNA recognition motif-containing protein